MNASERKRLLRVATAISEGLRIRESPQSKTAHMPEYEWDRCKALTRRLNKATCRGWAFAANHVREQLRLEVTNLQRQLDQLERTLFPSCNSAWLATPQDIYRDLLALKTEFESVLIDLRHRKLSVTTEPIELEDVWLGPFEIEIDWSRLAAGKAISYRVIACEARPAVSNDSVTHPHVSSEELCEGDGRQPIRNALAQGRLLDFFLVVANLLRTYNAGSAYVSLCDWSGEPCSDCGTGVAEYESHQCSGCDSSLCGECASSCSDCHEQSCNDCLKYCTSCEEDFCKGCLATCVDCDSDFCKSCLNENERCSSCEQRNVEEETLEVSAEC